MQFVWCELTTIFTYLIIIYLLKGEVEKQVAALRRQLAAVQPDIEASMRRMNEALSNEKIAREDLAIQVQGRFSTESF